MPISYFSDATVVDGTSVTSFINRDDLVAAIQGDSTDTYFDSTDEIGKVYVYYRHDEGRQQKKIVHTGPSLSGTVLWTDNARDGTWEKYRVLAFDGDGAQRDLNRSVIGTGEDATHLDGTIYLNIV